jgi:hypothetical protein
MEFALQAENDGKRLRLDPAQPLTLRVKRGDQPGGEIVVGLKDGAPFLDNRSTAICTVNGVEMAAARLAPDDLLQLGALRFTVVSVSDPLEVVEPTARTAPAPAQDSDRHRQQRRISASRMAAVDQPNQTSGLLKRVSVAFSGRAEKQRLDQLEAERRTALIEAGRRSLGDGSALGIPGQMMNQLSRGQAVQLRAEDLAGLTRWREDRQKLVRLDAEIAALRQALGMGADPDAVILAAPNLKSDERQKVERAFATMDEVGTQSLGGMADAAEPAPRPVPRRR